DLSASAKRTLEHIGVEVRTGASATDIAPDRVQIGDEIIPAYTTLWAAGVAASPLGRQLGLEVDRRGRVPVQPDLRLVKHSEVSVIGDLASLRESNGKLLPGVAPVAIQQGEAAADNVWRSITGKPRRAFHYFDRGSMATIGRAAAVAEIGGLHLSGF